MDVELTVWIDTVFGFSLVFLMVLPVLSFIGVQLSTLRKSFGNSIEKYGKLTFLSNT